MDYKKLAVLSNACHELQQFLEEGFYKVRSIGVSRIGKTYNPPSTENIELPFHYSDEFTLGVKALLVAEYERQVAKIEEVIAE